MTDDEATVILEGRIESLSEVFGSGNVQIIFDPETSSIIVIADDGSIGIPAKDLKHVAGALMQLDTLLYLLGIVT